MPVRFTLSNATLLETKSRTTIAPEDKGAVFSATPPLEAVRMLGSVAMSIGGNTLQPDAESDVVIGFLDIFTGGGVSSLGIFALGILPFINASIILQLLSLIHI